MEVSKPTQTKRAALRCLGLVAALLLAGVPAAPAAEIEGVHFADRLTSNSAPLILQSTALLRYRVLFRGYVGALYMGEGADSSMLFRDVPKRLEIEYFWGIPADKFAEVTTSGIAANRPDTVERLRPAIALWNGLYENVEAGDRYSVTYTPGLGTELARNGRSLGVVPGQEFGAAIFSIWFGDVPFDAQFRDTMLAKGKSKG